MGIAIVIDGMDGSGKTTLVRAVKAALEAQGKVVDCQAFPTHEGAVGSLIRKCFSDPSLVNERGMLALFIADGMDYDDNLVERLDKCDVLICDRHPMITTWAYQLDQHSVEALASMTAPENFDFDPSVIFIVDVPPDVAMERRSTRGGDVNPLFEKGIEHTEMLRTRYQAFSVLCDGNRPIGVLDGTLPTEELADIVIGVLDADS